MSDAVLKYGEPENYVNRELSWLEFNYRILGEARDKTTPLFERLKFLSITASNLDEFFMVRVASLKDMVHANYTKRDIAGMTAQEQLDAIDGKTHELVENQYRTYNRMLLPLLKQHGLRVVTEHEKLTKEEAVYVDRYFEESVYPVLTPMAVDSSRPFPLIHNKSLNIAALVRKKKGDGELEFAMVCVPGGLPRVVELPCQEGKSIIYLEEVIERNIDKLFLNYDIISCHPFRVMRNADLSIDEDEAEVIRLIFHKYVDEGYGAQRLSHYLHEQGIKSRDGKGFPNTTVNRIIKNIAYTGIIKNGESQSGYIDELRIIDVSTFSKAQEIMRQRTLPHGNVPLNCKGKSLLVGNIFCAHCGNRLTLTTSGRRVYRADGTVKYEPRMRYQCHYNVRHPGECDGQSGYGVTKLDGIVEKVIRMKFAEIAAAPESEILNHQHKKEIELARIKLDQANAHLAEKQKDLSDYKAETLKVIRGQSSLSVELLNALVKETETMIALAQTRIDAAQTEYESLLASAENLRQEYDRLLTWADLFDTCSFEAKKMIVAQFVKAVRVSRDYNIEIDFNVSFEEFQNFSVKNGEPVILQPLRSHTA